MSRNINDSTFTYTISPYILRTFYKCIYFLRKQMEELILTSMQDKCHSYRHFSANKHQIDPSNSY